MLHAALGRLGGARPQRAEPGFCPGHELRDAVDLIGISAVRERSKFLTKVAEPVAARGDHEIAADKARRLCDQAFFLVPDAQPANQDVEVTAIPT